MANNAEVRTGLTALVQTHFSNLLRNTIFDRMPALFFLLGRDGEKQGPNGLGVPNTGMVISGVDIPKAKREEILSSTQYMPIIQTSSPAAADGKALSQNDSMPVRANSDVYTTPGYFTRPRFKWCEVADPYEVWNKDVRRTSRAAKNEVAGWEAVTSLFTAENKSVMGTHLTRWQGMIWGTTQPTGSSAGAPTSESADVWDNIHSLANAMGTNNTYGGVDRSLSANAYWRGNTVSSQFAPDFENLINYCNFDLGFSKKNSGVDLILVDGTNFKKAKSEAKAKQQHVFTSAVEASKKGLTIPDFGAFGYKRELVRIDNTWIVYDPTCPANTVAALSLDTWTVAIHPDANFKVSTPKDQSEIEGGKDKQWGNVRTELMVVCEVPSLNAYFSNVS